MRDLLTQLVRVKSEMTVILGDLIYRTACAAAAMWAVSSLSLPPLYLFPTGPSRRPWQLQAVSYSGASVAPSGMFYPVIDKRLRR